MEVTSELRYENCLKIMLGSYVRFTFGNYVIKLSWIKKVRSYQVWKLHQNFVTKISLELRLKVTSELRYKYYVRIALGSFVRLLLGIQIGKKDTYSLHNGLRDYNFIVT